MTYKPPKKTHTNALKSRKKRTDSSRRWLLRQLNDPYVQEAKRQGYRSRAAYKILEINEKFKLIKKGQTIVDLGAAPGGWTQVALEKIGEKGKVVGIDLQPIEPIAGAYLIEGDFTEEEHQINLTNLLNGKVDLVLSDMAASACGIPEVDHARIMNLVELVFLFCQDHLKQGGAMVAKVLRGGTEITLLNQLKRSFQKVSHFKPQASRQESAEMYVVAMGYRG